MTKFENFPNTRWRTAAISKIVFGHNSAADSRFHWKFAWGSSFSQNL